MAAAINFSKMPILSLYGAVNAVLNNSGRFVHKPIGQKPRPAKAVNLQVFEQMEAAYADCKIQDLIDFIELLDEVVPDHIKTDPDHRYGELLDRITGSSDEQYIGPWPKSD